MATMVKEKPRAKKKTKEKRVQNQEISTEVPSTVNLPITEESNALTETADSQNIPVESNLPSTSYPQEHTVLSETASTQSQILLVDSQTLISEIPIVSKPSKIDSQETNVQVRETSVDQQVLDETQNVYKDVCHRLDIITFKDVSVNSGIPIEELENRLEASATYINTSRDQTLCSQETDENIQVPTAIEDNMIPSAPMFEESLVTENNPQSQEIIHDHSPAQLQCMPLEVALHICGGKEMAEIREMNEIEEALAEAGLGLRPEHPLVDLLSTYRCSAVALEQENKKLIKGYTDEEKSRSNLWKVEKKTVYDSVKCNTCATSISYNGQYEYATLLEEKLPVAQLRLEGLLKDAQESYCHHQHQVLLAYYQIEEYISETVQASVGEIREALTLVLQELRASGATTCLLKMEYFIDSLKRWARALCGALLARSDPRQLLFLLQQLFRQSHSVRWAAPLIRIPMCDYSDAARALAIMDLMLAAPVLETANECTEESSELWEELDSRGEGGAVTEGALRESDLLALLQALPLRALVARLLLLQRTDITETREYEWQHGARDVVRACCGVRALLASLARAARAHPHYARLRAHLRALAAHAQHAVRELHQHNRDTYPKEVAPQIEGELEAIFRAGWELLEVAGGGAPEDEHADPPPASLLRPAVRAAYCIALMTHLHEQPPLTIDVLSLRLPPLACGRCVRVAAAAADCGDAPETLAMVVDFLVQVALKPPKKCTGSCVSAARCWLPRLLGRHAYLFSRAVHSVAYVHQLEPLQPSAAILKPFCLHKWRPSAGEIRAVLDDWAQRSPQLLQYLLQELSYTPYDGLSLDSQLVVGSWLCALPAPAPDWAWNVLTRLRVHRSSWRLPLEAPAPELTSGLFAEAYAVLSSSWGHSLPVICEHGISALARVAAARAPVAAHALPLVMAAMTSSPESVSLTPQFSSVLTSLLSPQQSLVQWARGERATTPDILLRRMLAHIENQPSPAERDVCVSTWLHGLCHTGLSGAALAVADAALLATRHTYALQEPPEPPIVSHLVRNSGHCPVLCACALRAAHARRERDSRVFARLLHALDTQRAQRQRIHVDNALKKIGLNLSSEELIIYQTAAALLTAGGPMTLPLWTLLMYLYLHSTGIDSDPMPVGPLFFSGLIKSRTLAQLKKRLHETILEHHNQAETFRTLLNTRTEPEPSRENKSASPDTIIPRTSIADLTGESSGESETESEVTEDISETEERRRVNVNMLAYHEGAEKMLREYSCWLEAGERLRATPHHADVARFIPDAALSTAWAEQLKSIRPAPSSEDDDLRAPKRPPTPDPPLTPLQTAVDRIMRIKDRSHKRAQAPVISSSLGDVSFSNERQLKILIDKHTADLEKFARKWCEDVKRIATLDSRLWPLVRSLRHRKALPSVRKMCPKKCGTVVFALENHYEWPISENATRGIAENRSSARAALRELLRARPEEAKTVAALHTIARGVNSRQAALALAARAWRCAGAAAECGAASAALAAVVEQVADKWICSDSSTLAALVPEWCGGVRSAAQQELCRALLARVAGAGDERWRLYPLLVAMLPHMAPQSAFSYLSKFDVSRCTDEAARGQMLESLAAAAQFWGRDPEPEQQMLLELIGVHLSSLTSPQQLPGVALRTLRAAAAGRAPRALVAHVAGAAARHARDVPFDKLGHLLRELGAMWWRARAELPASQATYHATYAEHVAALQAALLRAFVARGVALSYAPERVSLNAWCALQESWSAWVSPHPQLPPLLAERRGGGLAPHAAMLRRAVDCVHQIMLDCPGCEGHLLGQVWEWVLQMYLGVTSVPAGMDARVQLSTLLSETSALPWREHQWPCAAYLPAALQISTTTDLEMQTWLADTLRGIEAATWLRDMPDCDTAPRLAALLQLFAGPLQLRTETLEQAVHLPWQRLPEMALEHALARFFVDHHNPLHPYHDTPQFRVILAACGMVPPSESARSRRACFVSQWTRAASAPTLVTHVQAMAKELHLLITALEPFLDSGGDELEELLSRAIVVMCMEPAATEALPVWRQWVSGVSSRRLGAAAVCAARALTSPQYFAPVADDAVAAFLNAGGSWSEAAQRLQGCAWAEPQRLLADGRLHAAYALQLAEPDRDAPALTVDLPSAICFGSKELIVSVWICALCRLACGSCAPAQAARALLARWAEPRMALLRVLSRADEPTYKHRLLCRFALCILSPSEPALSSLTRAYEACPGVLVSRVDVLSWAKDPSVKHLPMLAQALFPGSENYFAEEVRITGAV